MIFDSFVFLVMRFLVEGFACSDAVNAVILRANEIGYKVSDRCNGCDS